MKGRFFGISLLLATSFSLSGFQTSTDSERAKQINLSLLSIQQECQAAAGGDWQKWFDALDDFRKDLEPRIWQAHEKRRALQTIGSPLLFAEPLGAVYLTPKILAEFMQRPSIPILVSVSNWLKTGGIDLIVVPVPKVVEVYADRFSSHVPADGIAAPHVRRLLVELLNSNVEVVDLLPVFLQLRDVGEEPLYLATDSHWTDRGQLSAAREIARHLMRYPFIQEARSHQPIFRTNTARRRISGSNWSLLTDDQADAIRSRLEFAVTVVSTLDGKPFEEPENAPILVLGDSYTHYFRGAIEPGSGVDALLAKEINLPVANISSAGATTGPFKDILRDQARLKGTRVVVWIVTNPIVCYDSQWDLLKLPPLKIP